MVNRFEAFKMALRSHLLRDWILASLCGLLLYSVVETSFTTLQVFLFPTDINWLISLIGTAVYSLCQWWVLRRKFRRAYGWIVATVLGMALFVLMDGIASPCRFREGMDVIASPVGFCESSAAVFAGSFGVFVLILGTAQSLFFAARHIKGAWYWMGFNALALLAVLPVSVVMETLDDFFNSPVNSPNSVHPSWPFSAATILLGGTLWGLITGILLVYFANQKSSLNSQ
jgi:hypothetical protein